MREPLLAVAAKKLPIRFPVFASPKLDGVRAWWPEGALLSRKMKPFPNKGLESLASDPAFSGLDGEFIVGDPTAPDVFRKTSAALMSQRAHLDGLTLYVFDDLSRGPDAPFRQRLESLRVRCQALEGVVVVEQVLVKDADELQELEELWLSQGYEGVMVRDPAGRYKFGRSTEKEGILLKVKRFEDMEAEVLGAVELQHNENEATRDERGFAKRSSHQAGKTGAGTLGALRVRGLNGPFKGVKFEVGTGFDAALRAELWSLRGDGLTGQVVVVKFFPTGSKDKPRFPTYKGFRNVEVDG